ncbi:MAG: hypothetical protein KAV87_12575 [Desulfobacteraceae bacterium]|nr:hypothetical protein [Desulfobacteraceae bacterium]
MGVKRTKSPNMVLWVEDDIRTVKQIVMVLNKHFRIWCWVGKDSRKDLESVGRRIRSKETPVVLFVMKEGLPDLENIRWFVSSFRPRAVVSDLELGGDALGGLSVLSVAAEADRDVYSALFTGKDDESVERLARSMGINAVLKKTKDLRRPLSELIYEIFPNLKQARLAQKGLSVEIIDELRERNRKLASERTRLQRRLAVLEKFKGHKPLMVGEKRKQEKTIEQLKDQLQVVDRERQMIMAQQHDLVNTSGLVTDALSNIWSKPELIPPVMLEDLKTARIGAKHSFVLVKSLSELTSEKTGKKDKPASISRAFSEAYEIIARKIADSISVEIKIPDDLPLSAVPEHLLVRCTLNLILNARDAIQGRGWIVVRCPVKPRGKAKHVEVIIKDNGRGILKRNLPKVLDWAFSTKGKKYGMGLFVVKTVMDKYGGDVKVDSVRGKGTSVRLKIPIAKQK